MDLTPYVTTVEESLAAAAAAGDEQTRRAATALTAALEPAMRLGIMDALSELAFEVTDALGDRSVELRLESGQVRVVVTSAPTLDDAPASGAVSSETARITLRLPETLKSGAETEAARSGVSLNTWLIRAVEDSLRGGQRPRAGRGSDPSGHRLRGWVQA